LLLLSMLVWALIGRAWWAIRQAKAELADFEARFWSGSRLDGYYQQLCERGAAQLSGVEAIFHSGYNSLVQQGKRAGLSQAALINDCQAAMTGVQTRLAMGAYTETNWLATIATIAPYIGLMGTVFGVIDTFQGLLSATSQNSFQLVAPGISEALMTTAMGLAVAIPAVLGYNVLTQRLDQLFTAYELVQKEFIQLIKQQNGA